MQDIKSPCGKIPFQRSLSYADQEADFNIVYVTPELSWQMLELVFLVLFFKGPRLHPEVSLVSFQLSFKVKSSSIVQQFFCVIF